MSGKRKAPAKKSAAKKPTVKQKPASPVVGDNDPITEKRELIPEPPDKLPDPVDGSKAQKKLVGE